MARITAIATRAAIELLESLFELTPNHDFVLSRPPRT